MKQTVVSSLAEPVGDLWRNLQKEYTKEGNFYVASPLSIIHHQKLADRVEIFMTKDVLNESIG